MKRRNVNARWSRSSKKEKKEKEKTDEKPQPTIIAVNP
jgi:hypothetical protein